MKHIILYCGKPQGINNMTSDTSSYRITTYDDAVFFETYTDGVLTGRDIVRRDNMPQNAMKYALGRLYEQRQYIQTQGRRSPTWENPTYEEFVSECRRNLEIRRIHENAFKAQ